MDFLLDLHLFYIIEIRKGSFIFGTYGLGQIHQGHTVDTEEKKVAITIRQ